MRLIIFTGIGILITTAFIGYWLQSIGVDVGHKFATNFGVPTLLLAA